MIKGIPKYNFSSINPHKILFSFSDHFNRTVVIKPKLYKYNDVCTVITAGTRDKLLVEFYINCFANRQCPCAVYTPAYSVHLVGSTVL